MVVVRHLGFIGCGFVLLVKLKAYGVNTTLRVCAADVRRAPR